MAIALVQPQRVQGPAIHQVAETVDLSAIDNNAATVFDSPARYVECTAAGNLVFTLASDDTANAALKYTKAMLLGDVLKDLAIGKIWASSTGTYRAFR